MKGMVTSMKKRVVTAAMVAALVLAQSTAAFAANSPSTRPVISGGSGSSHSSGRATVSATVADEVSITGSGTTTPTYGGEATIGDTSVSFVKGSTHAVAGLPNGIVDTIGAINRNKTELTKAGTGLDLTGYNALVGTYAVMTYKAGTTVEKTGNVTMNVYVPNLVAGLGDVQVLFYNNMTGKWQLIKPSAVDTAKKTITVTIPNSGTISVIYKK